jgi:hypothetical protein
VSDSREGFWQTQFMTRMEVDELRERCRAAFAAYDAHFSNVMKHSKGGTSPPPGNLHAEESAFYEFGKMRRDLLHALATLNP